MITLLAQGVYILSRTKDHKILLTLGDQGYYWSHAPQIGELLTWTKRTNGGGAVWARGTYKLYSIKDEKAFVDLQHLELSVGEQQWQGYLLLTGLPTAKKIRRRIIRTDEVISAQP